MKQNYKFIPFLKIISLHPQTVHHNTQVSCACVSYISNTFFVFLMYRKIQKKRE